MYPNICCGTPASTPANIISDDPLPMPDSDMISQSQRSIIVPAVIASIAGSITPMKLDVSIIDPPDAPPPISVLRRSIIP
jgi:hypothetical protein